MTQSGRSAASTPAPAADIPTAEEALARLDMPLGEAMRTQRAIRKLHNDPEDIVAALII